MNRETRPIPGYRPAASRFDGERMGRRLARLPRLAWQRYRRWCAARRAIRHLREIDAYLLDDIGIERAEITELAHGGKGPVHGPGRRFPQPAAPNTQGRLAA